MNKKGLHPTLERANAIEQGIKNADGVLFSILDNPGKFRRLSISINDRGEYWAVAKEDQGGDRDMVAFGNGFDAFVALAALASAVQAGRWSVDKPYQGG